MTGRTTRRRVTRISVSPAQVTERPDLLATEEPLGIRIGGQAVSMTMRTPGDDVDLAAGFLLSEGIIAAAGDVASIVICTGERCGHDHGGRDHDGDDDHDRMGNIADVTLRTGVGQQPARRNFLTTSACGVCGKASVEDLRVTSR